MNIALNIAFLSISLNTDRKKLMFPTLNAWANRFRISTKSSLSFRRSSFAILTVCKLVNKLIVKTS